MGVVLFSYSIGFVYLFFLVAVFTDIASAINYCSYYPKQTYGYAFIFSLTGYLDCIESCEAVWCICGSHSYYIPKSNQYCSIICVLLEAIYLPLCLQRTPC